MLSEEDKKIDVVEEKMEEKGSKSNRKKIITIILLVAIAVIIVGFGVHTLLPHGDKDSKNSGSTGTLNGKLNLEEATGSKKKISEIASQAGPSVVEIRTESVGTDGWLRQYVKKGAGSGVIISKDGYIVTNHHVIANANRIEITTSDKKTYKAKLVGDDAQTDLALLKVSANNLTPATIGRSDKIAVGELAVVIGNPLGELGGSVSAGIISAKDRKMTIEKKNMKLIQTDATVNPGNSGGGMFNQYGQLIGIVVAKSSGTGIEGLGFAIPTTTLRDVLPQLKKNGKVTGRVDTGIETIDIQSNMDLQKYKVDKKGVYVLNIKTKKALKSGLISGDRLVSVNGKSIDKQEDLEKIIKGKKVGDKLKIKFERRNQSISTTLELGDQSKEEELKTEQQEEQQTKPDPFSSFFNNFF